MAVQPWIVVTGGNRGIGYDVCRKLVETGRPVLLCSRNKNVGQDAAAKIMHQAGSSTAQCRCIQLDVSNPMSIKSFIKEVGRDYHQQIYALINNAGVYPFGWTREIFDDTLSINFRGPLDIAFGLAPHMINGGRIVNLTSGLGYLSNLSPAYQKRVSAASLESLQEMVFDPADDFGFKPTYCLSKAMINRASFLMNDHPDFRHLNVNAADPGWCRSLDQGSESVLAVLNLPSDVRGGVFSDGKRKGF